MIHHWQHWSAISLLPNYFGHLFSCTVVFVCKL